MAKATIGCEGCPNQLVFTADTESMDSIVAIANENVPKSINDIRGSDWSDTEYGQRWCEKQQKEYGATCGFSGALRDLRFIVKDIVEIVK